MIQVDVMPQDPLVFLFSIFGAEVYSGYIIVPLSLCWKNNDNMQFNKEIRGLIVKIRAWKSAKMDV